MNLDPQDGHACNPSIGGKDRKGMGGGDRYRQIPEAH